MKKIKEIGLGMGMKYEEYECPDGRVPGKCPNVYGCLLHAVTNGDEGRGCIYIKRPE